VLGYDELYGWTMDDIVKQVGMKNNCTFCGVFRRQALDRGAATLGVDHIITGHNADDMAETILMNVLRGDVARLERCTDICTRGPEEGALEETEEGCGAHENELVELVSSEVNLSSMLMKRKLSCECAVEWGRKV
jgi:cytoplasmic tRNA 2-thiolation protein 1